MMALIRVEILAASYRRAMLRGARGEAKRIAAEMVALRLAILRGDA